MRPGVEIFSRIEPGTACDGGGGGAGGYLRARETGAWGGFGRGRFSDAVKPLAPTDGFGVIVAETFFGAAGGHPCFVPARGVITCVSTLGLMLLELKLRKVGNSVGIVLPKEALSYLKVGEGDVICITEASEGSLRVSPAKADFNRQMQTAQDVVARYRNTLRELAK